MMFMTTYLGYHVLNGVINEKKQIICILNIGAEYLIETTRRWIGEDQNPPSIISNTSKAPADGGC